MSFVVRRSGHSISDYEVGYFKPAGEFVSCGVFFDFELCMKRAHYLNGGNVPPLFNWRRANVRALKKILMKNKAERKKERRDMKRRI